MITARDYKRGSIEQEDAAREKELWVSLFRPLLP